MRIQPATHAGPTPLPPMPQHPRQPLMFGSATPQTPTPAAEPAKRGFRYLLFLLKQRLFSTPAATPVTPCQQKALLPMTPLRFDATNASANKVGSEHGLDLPKEFAAHREQVAGIVKDLYATKDEEGGWKKWLNLGYNTQLAEDVSQYAQSVKDQYSDMVVLGIGGSSLGGYAMLKALLDPNWNLLSEKERNGYPRFHFVENVDADQITSLQKHLDPKKTLFVVISKSGTTPETMAGFMIFKQWLQDKLGAGEVKNHIAAITDKTTGVLRPLADTEGYPSFEVPDDVGGRFSVFSAVGLLPAALCGVDVKELQRGIRDLDAQLQNPDIDQNIAAQNALIQYLMYNKGKDISVFMPYSTRLSAVAAWYTQLWAESLGKQKDLKGNDVFVGPTPVPAVGATDQHSQVQLFNEGPNNKILTFVQVKNPDNDVTIPDQLQGVAKLDYLRKQPLHRLMTAELDGTKDNLTANQRPNVTLSIPRIDAYYFAQLLYLLEVQTAIAGELFGINTYDQPGVEGGKKRAEAYLNQQTTPTR